MSPRRRRKEEEEEIKKQRKALKKSFKQTHESTRKIGSRKLSDTQKYLLIGSVVGILCVIVAVQFLPPPIPYCYYTEADFVHATLDQDTQTISFNRIIAWYRARPINTYLSCNIMDFFNESFDVRVNPSTIDSSITSNDILYRFTDESSTLMWETFMENGTPLAMSTWVNITTISITPSSVQKGITKEVNFKLDIVMCVAVDRCNISLELNKNLVNTSIVFLSIKNGTVNVAELIFFTTKTSLSANKHVILDFNLSINTNQTVSSLNLLKKGTIHLVMNNKLIDSYLSSLNFKESNIDFSGFLYERVPKVVKTNFLDIVINIPYYKIILT